MTEPCGCRVWIGENPYEVTNPTESITLEHCPRHSEAHVRELEEALKLIERDLENARFGSSYFGWEPMPKGAPELWKEDLEKARAVLKEGK